MGPLRANNILSILDFSRIFSNIELVMLAAQDVSRALEARRRKSGINGISGIGDIFLSRVDDLIPVYSNYCSHQGEALAALEKAKTKKPFVQFCQEQRAIPATKGLEVDQWVIKPVQRICKYPLLFKVGPPTPQAMQRRCSSTDTAGHATPFAAACSCFV
jgi:nitrite reductase/ring-hydroxylating ferredoxin subunit